MHVEAEVQQRRRSSLLYGSRLSSAGNGPAPSGPVDVGGELDPVAHGDLEVLVDEDLARHRASSRVDAPTVIDLEAPELGDLPDTGWRPRLGP